jgi:hypothetical protein
MKRSLVNAFAFALLLSNAFGSSAQAKGVPGAIFTTTVDGSIVNANLYDSKCAVYLDGGPGPNAPANAAGLPDGEYYFQVTDPSGDVLLSTDPVSNRRFLVAGGVIVAYTGDGSGPIHPTGTDQDHPELGAITIRIANDSCPSDFLDTPNNGGVYKVWATPVGDFVGDASQVDNDCGGGCFHGFVASQSKTDNFKVGPTTVTFCLTVIKEFIIGDQAVRTANWQVTVDDPLNMTNVYFTDQNGEVRVCGLVPGSYTITEDTSGAIPVGLFFNGDSLTPQGVYSFIWQSGDQEPVVLFQNEGVTIGILHLPATRPGLVHSGHEEAPLVLLPI